MRALNYIRTFKKKSYCILFHPVARPICRPLSKLTGAKATSYLLLQLFCSVKLSLPSSPSPLILHHHPSIPPAFHFSLAGRLRLIAHRPGNSFFPLGEKQLAPFSPSPPASLVSSPFLPPYLCCILLFCKTACMQAGCRVEVQKCLYPVVLFTPFHVLSFVVFPCLFNSPLPVLPPFRLQILLSSPLHSHCLTASSTIHLSTLFTRFPCSAPVVIPLS